MLISKGVVFIKWPLLKNLSMKIQITYDVIFNCLGLGAIEFCNDDKLVLMRGKMIRVRYNFRFKRFFK